MSLMIVVLNFDGSYYGSYKEGSGLRGKVNVTGLSMDSNNIITAAIDASQTGTSTSKFATVIRFSVAIA